MDHAELGMRFRLEGILANCGEAILADAAAVRKRRPELAHMLAPDEFAETLRTKQWVRRPIAALDAGEELPFLPD